MSCAAHSVKVKAIYPKNAVHSKGKRAGKSTATIGLYVTREQASQIISSIGELLAMSALPYIRITGHLSGKRV